MGGLVSYFWGATETQAVTDGNVGDMNVPDQTTGLTGHDRKIVTDTWSLVKKDIKTNGIDLFISFFTTYPEYQARFAAFYDVPLDKLRENRKLMAHAMSVMYAITAVVDNLNDTDCLIEMLSLLGTNHQRRKIPQQAFDDLKKVLLSLLQQKLGANLPPAGVAAWEKTLTVAYSVIFKAMNDFEGASAPEKTKGKQ